MHNNIEPSELFKGFCEVVTFLYKIIRKLSAFEKPDYDIYLDLLELAILKVKKENNTTKMKYDWEIKLNGEFLKLNNSIILKEDLKRIAFLKKGYPFKLEKFISFFK